MGTAGPVTGWSSSPSFAETQVLLGLDWGGVYIPSMLHSAAVYVRDRDMRLMRFSSHWNFVIRSFLNKASRQPILNAVGSNALKNS